MKKEFATTKAYVTSVYDYEYDPPTPIVPEGEGWELLTVNVHVYDHLKREFIWTWAREVTSKRKVVSNRELESGFNQFVEQVSGAKKRCEERADLREALFSLLGRSSE